MDLNTIVRFLNESGSDKETHHSYSSAYHHFLDGREVKNFLEIGIANHTSRISSLHAWKNIFPDAHIYGIDNDVNKMIQDERISTYWYDQSSTDDVQKFMHETDGIYFDVILDDGSHIFKHAVHSFVYLINKLSQNGIYLIEDVWKVDHPFLQNVAQWENFLNTQSQLNYGIIDCKPDVQQDDSIVIGVWKR